MNDRGSSTITLAVLAPVLLLLAAFAVYIGRVASTQAEVRAVARDAARSASIQPANAQAAAEDTARRALATRDVSCGRLDISVDSTTVGDLDALTVTVRCSISTRDLTGLRLGGERTVDASATEVVDHYRSTP